MSENDSQPKEISVSWNGLTDVGRFRTNNEDAFLALNFDAQEVRYLGKDGSASMDGDDFIFAVSDGMGGANAGEFASKIAVDKITELLPKTFHLGAIGLDRGCGQILSELFSRIHKEMVQMGSYYEECRGMGATLSLCWLTPSVMHFGHVGDSRIYYLPKEGEFTQITEDHTHVGYLVRQGKITEYEARTRRDRNILDQALGGNVQRIDPQIGSVVYSPGDRFVLCTDGVTDGISNRRIHSLVDFPPASLEPLNPAERLVIDAKQESGRDNITALVLQLG
jgi:protein phosphatase